MPPQEGENSNPQPAPMPQVKRSYRATASDEDQQSNKFHESFHHGDETSKMSDPSHEESPYMTPTSPAAWPKSSASIRNRPSTIRNSNGQSEYPTVLPAPQTVRGESHNLPAKGNGSSSRSHYGRQRGQALAGPRGSEPFRIKRTEKKNVPVTGPTPNQPEAPYPSGAANYTNFPTMPNMRQRKTGPFGQSRNHPDTRTYMNNANNKDGNHFPSTTQQHWDQAPGINPQYLSGFVGPSPGWGGSTGYYPLPSWPAAFPNIAPGAQKADKSPQPEKPRSEPLPPDPEKLRMEAESKAFKAAQEQMKSAERQRELEAQIRKDAEEAFAKRLEDMRRLQEQAKREIESAKIEGERAARERMLTERKLEKERQRQHAEMMQQVEDRVRIQHQNEIIAEEDRKKKEEEDNKRREEVFRVQLHNIQLENALKLQKEKEIEFEKRGAEIKAAAEIGEIERQAPSEEEITTNNELEITHGVEQFQDHGEALATMREPRELVEDGYTESQIQRAEEAVVTTLTLQSIEQITRLGNNVLLELKRERQAIEGLFKDIKEQLGRIDTPREQLEEEESGIRHFLVDTSEATGNSTNERAFGATRTPPSRNSQFTSIPILYPRAPDPPKGMYPSSDSTETASQSRGHKHEHNYYEGPEPQLSQRTERNLEKLADRIVDLLMARMSQENIADLRKSPENTKFSRPRSFRDNPGDSPITGHSRACSPDRGKSETFYDRPFAASSKPPGFYNRFRTFSTSPLEEVFPEADFQASGKIHKGEGIHPNMVEDWNHKSHREDHTTRDDSNRGRSDSQSEKTELLKQYLDEVTRVQA